MKSVPITQAHYRTLERKLDEIAEATRPKQPEPSAAREAPPHPLMLNPTEGIWMHYAVGPIDGWFSFGLHGNPPFNTPVQVLMTTADIGERGFVAVGVRTKDVDPCVVKERWQLNGQFDFNGAPRMQMTHWRPLSLPPASVKQPEPRP